jgi:hypothetical protein
VPTHAPAEAVELFWVWPMPLWRALGSDTGRPDYARRWSFVPLGVGARWDPGRAGRRGNRAFDTDLRRSSRAAGAGRYGLSSRCITAAICMAIELGFRGSLCKAIEVTRNSITAQSRDRPVCLNHGLMGTPASI